MRKKIIAFLAINLMLFSVGCASQKDIQDLPVEVPQGITEEEPTGDAADPSSIVLEGADEAKKIDITAIKTIEMFDIDGNKVEKTFSEDEILSIGTAYNESMINDISYIQMIAGYSMDVTLDDGQILHFTSYGDENNVIATTNDITYHLICPEIGKILLTEI